MRTPDDFRPLFEDMTEMDFTGLMEVCFEFAQKNNIEIQFRDDERDELASNLEEAETKITDLEDEIKDMKKESGKIADKLNSFLEDFREDFPDYDANEVEEAITKLNDL